ncbi:mechanosensitive ion channel domain-containing protein [uncultured Bartonella sp.]|uniref:mechanosensitive ion channel family protein n=1 Tax=uncultured Bartonella sp. TaxID=104108 RepID=UPI0026344F9C|nr:mechanosensitive ion channel domain-containing protein [uncultured Bartonella sp.]
MKRIYIGMLFVAIGFASPLAGHVSLGTVAFAQTPAATDTISLSPTELVKQQQPIANGYKDTLKDLQKEFDDGQDDDSVLTDVRNKAQSVNTKIINTALLFRSPLNDINLRLDQLGDPPQGVQEAKTITDERNSLRQTKVKINTLVGQLEDASIDANRLVERTVAQSRELFARTLTHRVEFSSPLGKQIAQSAKDSVADFFSLAFSWWQFVYQFKLLALCVSILIPFGVALVLIFFTHKLIGRVKQEATRQEEDVSYLKRLSFAFVATLVPTIICVVFVVLVLLFFDYLGISWAALDPVFRSAAEVVMLVFFIARMSFVILSPKSPQLRLMNIAPKPARLLIVLLTLLALVMGLDYFFNTVYRAVSAPLSLSIAKSFISVILVGIIILAISFVRGRTSSEDDQSVTSWPRYIRIPLVIVGLLPILTALAGYVGMARFISQQIVVSGAFLVLMYLGIQTARATAAEGAFAKTFIGRRLVERFKIDDSTMDQLGLVAGIILNIMVIVVCVPPIIMQLGFSASDILSAFIHIMTGFEIGNVSISLVGIFIGIAFFLVSWFLIRWFISWLDGTVLARGKVDSGVRNSIRTVVGYGGIALSALIGLSAAGFNLSSLALIAGGLSLGIGFGLQNIVQNFVSGLILLAERPFKVGDYVETGTTSGIVKRISVRATEVETFKRQTIIVPNSSLINNNVGNWTHRNKIGRVDITFTVPAMSDPEHIGDVLMDIANTTEGVLKNPSPWVSFSSFDSNNFNFSLAIYVPDITATVTVSNNIRFEAYKRFSDEGIT